LEEVEGRLYRRRSCVQSEEVAVLAGVVGVAFDVELLALDSLEPDLLESDLLESDLLESDLLESDEEPESLDDVVADDDFDLPPRLSVL
jgi:hypothetical protein